MASTSCAPNFFPERPKFLSNRKQITSLPTAILLAALLFPYPISANDVTEGAGVGIGLTAGNMWFVPAKAVSLIWGMTAGALSYVLTAGDAEMTKQIWQDTTQGPYLITPDVARTGIGERPELEKR